MQTSCQIAVVVLAALAAAAQLDCSPGATVTVTNLDTVSTVGISKSSPLEAAPSGNTDPLSSLDGVSATVGTSARSPDTSRATSVTSAFEKGGIANPIETP